MAADTSTVERLALHSDESGGRFIDASHSFSKFCLLIFDTDEMNLERVTEQRIAEDEPRFGRTHGARQKDVPDTRPHLAALVSELLGRTDIAQRAERGVTDDVGSAALSFQLRGGRRYRLRPLLLVH